MPLTLTDDERRAADLAQTPSEYAYWTKRLSGVFGVEWFDIVRPARQAIIADVIDAFATVDGFDLLDYRRNIGEGNLVSYAACQLIRFTRP